MFATADRIAVFVQHVVFVQFGMQSRFVMFALLCSHVEGSQLLLVCVGSKAVLGGVARVGRVVPTRVRPCAWRCCVLFQGRLEFLHGTL